MKTEPIERQTVTSRDPRSDGQLLAEFLEKRESEAFSQLMQRHGPYLFAVCRRVTGHLQDAEDVFQASFLELVRNARKIVQHDSVAGWLQTIAIRLAGRARTRRIQLQEREVSDPMDDTLERRSTAVGPNTLDEVSWREVRQILDEEVARLPKDLRAAVIVCLFEGRSNQEAAQFLELNPRTLRDQVQRGRALLKERLSRRGVAFAVVGALLVSGSVEAAVPTTLVHTTLAGARAVANNSTLTGVVSSSVIGLTGTSGLSIGWGLIAGALLTLLLVGGGIALGGKSLFSAKTPQQVIRSFKNSQFDHRFFRWSPAIGMRFARREPEGLRFTLPDKVGLGVPVGVALKHAVRGDFDLQVTFEFLRMGLPKEGRWAGTTVYLFFDDDERNGVWFGKMLDRQLGPVFATGHRSSPRLSDDEEEPERIDRFVNAVSTEAETGVFRVRAVRKGAVLTLFAADGETDALRQLHMLDVSAENLEIVRLGTDPGWSAEAPMDMRIIEFSMTCEEFVGFRPTGS